jgi:putative RecB family exonuclease
MSKQELQKFQDELHISYSQIFVYLSCSLKYRFMYVEQRPYERLGVALPFGRGIHASIERYYRSLMKGQLEPVSILEELFEDHISTALDHSEIPILFKKEAPDRDSVIRMGKSLLKTFYENIDLSGMEILAVEMPLSGTLYTDSGESTDFKVIGVIDLLLQNQKSELIAVDHKTASKPYAQASVDDDLQFSSYAYLLASNKYVPVNATVNCRLDALRKLKTPKLEHYYTTRTAAQRKRFAKIANAVLAGIESGIFIPSKSWFCSDCGFIDACEAW